MATNPLGHADNELLSGLMGQIRRELSCLYAEEGGLPGEVFRRLNYGEDVPVRELAMSLKRQIDALVPSSEANSKAGDPDLELFP